MRKAGLICPSSNPSLFEPELEFFVFSPGGVASTGLIQSTQTSCSTTPAATVSRPPPCRAPQPHPPLSLPPAPTYPPKACLHQLRTHLSPWLPPCIASVLGYSPAPPTSTFPPHLAVILSIRLVQRDSPPFAFTHFQDTAQICPLHRRLLLVFVVLLLYRKRIPAQSRSDLSDSKSQQTQISQ